jgi:hypothetical protein
MKLRAGLTLAVLLLSLPGCATLPPPAIECATPPSPPAAVTKLAEQPAPNYFDSVRPLLDWLNRLLQTAPD